MYTVLFVVVQQLGSVVCKSLSSMVVSYHRVLEKVYWKQYFCRLRSVSIQEISQIMLNAALEGRDCCFALSASRCAAQRSIMSRRRGAPTWLISIQNPPLKGTSFSKRLIMVVQDMIIHWTAESETIIHHVWWVGRCLRCSPRSNKAQEVLKTLKLNLVTGRLPPMTHHLVCHTMNIIRPSSPSWGLDAACLSRLMRSSYKYSTLPSWEERR